MLTVEVIESEEVDGVLPIEKKRIESFAKEVLIRNEIERGEYNIIFIDDAFMAELNEKYKGRTGPTDVLSFNLSDEQNNTFSGEVYVSLPRAKEQSLEYGGTFEREVMRLVVHGLLHLAGYVHDSEDAYAVMNGRTEDLVSAFFHTRD